MNLIATLHLDGPYIVARDDNGHAITSRPVTVPDAALKVFEDCRQRGYIVDFGSTRGPFTIAETSLDTQTR